MKSNTEVVQRKSQNSNEAWERNILINKFRILFVSCFLAAKKSLWPTKFCSLKKKFRIVASFVVDDGGSVAASIESFVFFCLVGIGESFHTSSLALSLQLLPSWKLKTTSHRWLCIILHIYGAEKPLTKAKNSRWCSESWSACRLFLIGFHIKSWRIPSEFTSHLM